MEHLRGKVMLSGEGVWQDKEPPPKSTGEKFPGEIRLPAPQGGDTTDTHHTGELPLKNTEACFLDFRSSQSFIEPSQAIIRSSMGMCTGRSLLKAYLGISGD